MCPYNPHTSCCKIGKHTIHLIRPWWACFDSWFKRFWQGKPFCWIVLSLSSESLLCVIVTTEYILRCCFGIHAGMRRELLGGPLFTAPRSPHFSSKGVYVSAIIGVSFLPYIGWPTLHSHKSPFQQQGCSFFLITGVPNLPYSRGAYSSIYIEWPTFHSHNTAPQSPHFSSRAQGSLFFLITGVSILPYNRGVYSSI